MKGVRQAIETVTVIPGEESSGNNNYYNEKVSIMNTISRKLLDFVVDDLEGINLNGILLPKFWDGKCLVNEVITHFHLTFTCLATTFWVPVSNFKESPEICDRDVNPFE
jgi:hypothetical protein